MKCVFEITYYKRIKVLFDHKYYLDKYNIYYIKLYYIKYSCLELLLLGTVYINVNECKFYFDVIFLFNW